MEWGAESRLDPNAQGPLTLRTFLDNCRQLCQSPLIGLGPWGEAGPCLPGPKASWGGGVGLLEAQGFWGRGSTVGFHGLPCLSCQHGGHPSPFPI